MDLACAEPAADHVVDPDAVKRLEQAIRVGEAFRDFAGAGVGLNGRCARVARYSNQGSPKGKLQLSSHRAGTRRRARRQAPPVHS